MFYCDPCGRQRNWPADDLLIPTSYGRCEICGKTAECNDVPAGALPVPPAAPPSVEAKAGKPRRLQSYIASTDVEGPPPHVVAQWDGDDLIEVVVNNVSGGPLTVEQFTQGWQIARDLKAVREES